MGLTIREKGRSLVSNIIGRVSLGVVVGPLGAYSRHCSKKTFLKRKRRKNRLSVVGKYAVFLSRLMGCLQQARGLEKSRKD